MVSANSTARSTLEPDAALELEFVYGYDGVTNNAPNLFFTGGDSVGQVAYYTAAVGVVYDRRKDTQRHFLGHTKVGAVSNSCLQRYDTKIRYKDTTTWW